MYRNYKKSAVRSRSSNMEIDSIPESLLNKWKTEQLSLKDRLVLIDAEEWQTDHSLLKYVGGVDISFIKGDNVNACAAFVVCSYPDMKVVHKDLSMVKLTEPYIPGFLAFRECSFLIEKINNLKETNNQIFPQVILVDGNGILHPRGLGLASHMGVILNLPFVGVAKNLYHVDGLARDDEHKDKIKNMKKSGDCFHLVSNSGSVLGLALRSCNNAPNPIYISQGHKISLETAKWLVMQCIKFRIPEPVRHADLLSREFLRKL